MSIDAEAIADRRRLRRKLSFWRVAGFLGLIAAVAAIEDGRRPGMVDLVARLAAQGYLRDGVSRNEAAQILTVITSFQAFDELFGGLGLPADTVAERLISMTERSILRPDLPA